MRRSRNVAGLATLPSGSVTPLFSDLEGSSDCCPGWVPRMRRLRLAARCAAHGLGPVRRHGGSQRERRQGELDIQQASSQPRQRPLIRGSTGRMQWYASLTVGDEHVVVFSGRVRRMKCGDQSRRAEVEGYARPVEAPGHQTDHGDRAERATKLTYP